ncbi:hypothetical protein ACVWXM_006995 [Bradyrhizobium sp. GM7.3]
MAANLSVLLTTHLRSEFWHIRLQAAAAHDPEVRTTLSRFKVIDFNRVTHLGLAITLMAGTLSALLVEQPMLRLRRRIDLEPLRLKAKLLGSNVL